MIEVNEVRVPLPRPEDLIILTAMAHRPQDLADIEAILVAQPRLHLRRVRRRVQKFSVALSMPEILCDLERYSLKVANGEGKTDGGKSLVGFLRRQPPLSSAKKGEAQGGVSNCGSRPSRK